MDNKKVPRRKERAVSEVLKHKTYILTESPLSSYHQCQPLSYQVTMLGAQLYFLQPPPLSPLCPCPVPRPPLPVVDFLFPI